MKIGPGVTARDIASAVLEGWTARELSEDLRPPMERRRREGLPPLPNVVQRAPRLRLGPLEAALADLVGEYMGLDLAARDLLETFAAAERAGYRIPEGVRLAVVNIARNLVSADAAAARHWPGDRAPDPPYAPDSSID